MKQIAKDSEVYNAAKDFIHAVWKSKDRDTFPGSHPVSIERNHMPLLKNKYVVCEKTDGTRFMMICFVHDDKKISLFVNRNMDMYQISLCVPRNTILDGELVKTRGDESYYMVFDGNMVNGVDIQNLNYIDRLKHTEVVSKGPSTGIKIKIKTVWPISAIAHIETLHFPYETDGYIFTPVDEPVRMETHETMFKWKPLNRITVDFKVMYKNGMYGLYVWDRGSYVYEAHVSNGEKYNDKIVECLFDGNAWTPIKIRLDKPRPNNRRTFYRTLVNIRENITVDDFTLLFCSN
jgi:mRNA guanylyltransferase